MLFPSWFWWQRNLFWIVVLSWWALVATHWGAWQAVRAELVAGRAEVEARRVAAMVAIHNQEMLERIIEAVEKNGKG